MFPSMAVVIIGLSNIGAFQAASVTKCVDIGIGGFIIVFVIPTQNVPNEILPCILVCTAKWLKL